MKKTKLWVIWGETGQWDSHDKWMVEILFSEKKAEDMLDKCNRFLSDHGISFEKKYEMLSGSKNKKLRRFEKSKEFLTSPDRYFSIHFVSGQGIHYFIEERETIDKV
jgi:hypothetical protein